MTETSTVASAPDATPAPAATKPPRVVSLDALRAIVVALMIFMDHPLIISALPRFLVHPLWHGFRLPDFVFPAFVFIAGVSLAFSTRRLTAETFPATTRTFVKRIAYLFLIGVALNFGKYSLPFFREGLAEPFLNLRYMGVLQRIALGTLAAWPLVRKDWRWAAGGAAALMAAHTALLLWVAPAGVTAGGWVTMAVGTEQIAAVKDVTLAGWLDRTLFGVTHTYQQSGFDPEGLLGVLTTAAQAMLGLAAGKWFVRDEMSGRIVPGMLVAGAAAVAVSYALAPWVPINKYLWTATFVLVSSGFAMLALAAMYWWLDIKAHAHRFEWLVPLGRNALLLYICSNVFVIGLRVVPLPVPGGGWDQAFHAIGAWGSLVLPGALVSVLFAAAEVAMWVWVAKILYDRKWFFKL